LNIRISAEREILDPRSEIAKVQPHRRDFPDPLDVRLECPLGRLSVSGVISEREYKAGCQWRAIYHSWLCSIGAPNPFPSALGLGGGGSSQEPLSSVFDDEREEAIARAFKLGASVLKDCGHRVFHAVNAIAVYEEPEELGDFEYTSRAAKIGLAALADLFG
jgi:hypothetical protein